MEYDIKQDHEYDDEAKLRRDKIARRAAESAIEATYGYVDPNEGWQLRGLCTQIDPDVFFPEKGASVSEQKKVCKRCEVRPVCLDNALAQPANEDFGVWGGLSKRERDKLRQSRSASDAHQQAS